MAENCRIHENPVFRLGYLLLLFGLVLLSRTTTAGQSTGTPFNNRYEPSKPACALEDGDKLRAPYDSLAATFQRPRKYPVYRGFEIALGFPSYTLQSSIPQLNHLQTTFIGSTLGGVFANQIGKVKANVGMFYSGSSVPYTIDMLQGGVSANLYLLRLKQIKFHSIEPYAAVGVSHQQAKFYGTYLDQGAYSNNSTADEPLLGRAGWTQMSIGTGVEFQLENDHYQCIHLFTELCYGVPFQFDRSKGPFAKTRNQNPWWISVGIHVGMSK